MNLEYITDIGKRAKAAQSVAATLTSKQKNDALVNIGKLLRENTDKIIKANKLDTENAVKNGISEVMIDRLMLNEARVNSIADALNTVVELADPVGEIEGGQMTPGGLEIIKKRVPLGVIGIIFESRPNVTVDAAALCIKSSNVAILRGGKEAINSNKALADVMREALKQSGLPEDMVILIENTDREIATQMMKLNDYIDVLIPRGGAGLIKSCVQNATVPVIETGTGNCHVYVDASADIDMAVNILNNAKTSRPSVCNACESLLVHNDIAKEFLPLAKKKLDEHNVVWLGCERTKAILCDDEILTATEADYKTEFLDYKISVKVVDSTEEAIEHINRYSTGHSECIVTNNFQNANLFTQRVDSAAVYVNASTRFTDGGEFMLGAEIGISTQKLHARGPMGLRELTTTKYVIHGNGQIR